MTVAHDPSATTLSAAEFLAIRTALAREAAIVLDDSQQYLAESRIRPQLDRLGIASLTEFTMRVGRREEVATRALIDAMTINETSFFRDLHPFEALRPWFVTQLAQADSADPFTIWCAAGSSGQEPYSLAMMLLEHHPGAVARRVVRIVSSDISPEMIERSNAGWYSTFETNRGLSPERLQRFFVPDGRGWAASAELRGLVEFEEVNLVGEWHKVPRAHLVLLRNVLIYFNVETKAEVLARVRRDVLRPGGRLLLGASETTLNVDEAFVRHEVDGSIYYTDA